MEDMDLDFLAGVEEAEARAKEKADAVDDISKDTGEQECDGCKI